MHRMHTVHWIIIYGICELPRPTRAIKFWRFFMKVNENKRIRNIFSRLMTQVCVVPVLHYTRTLQAFRGGWG